MMSTTLNSPRTLLLSVLAVLIILPGCSPSGRDQINRSPVVFSPPAMSETAINLNDTGFYRIGSTVTPDVIQVKIGREHQDTLFLPKRSPFIPVPVGPDDRFSLADAVPRLKFTPNAETLLLTTASNYGLFTNVVNLPKSLTLEDLGEIRISTIPDDIREIKAKRNMANTALSKDVSVMIREVLAPHIEFRSPSITFDGEATLEFGIALESDFSEEQASPVEFTVSVQHENTRTSVFSETPDRPDPEEESWHSFKVDLSEWSGKTFRLVFNTNSASSVMNSLSPLWGNPTVYLSEGPEEDTRPNVLLISLDTLRADHLGTYGYDRNTSPNIDAFAEGAFLFERCIASSPWTTPSHATVFTGLHPTLHPRVNHSRYRLPDSMLTLADIFGAENYVTAGFTEGLLVGGDFGFSQGFGLYSDGETDHPLPPGSSAMTFKRAERWLQEKGHFPFFLFVHTYQIHSPYQPPSPFLEQFASGKHKRIVVEEMSDSEQDQHDSIDLYDGEIAFTDQALGEFLDSVREMGLLEDTIVIIMSDHGEEFWEHEGVAHGLALYREALHVPLIIRVPGKNAPSGRIEKLVGLPDLFATLLDLTGIDSESLNDSYSLTPLMNLEGSSEEYARPFVASQLRQINQSYLLLTAQTDTFKYLTATAFASPISPLHDYAGLMQRGLPIEAFYMNALSKQPPEPTTPIGPGTWRDLGTGVRESLFDTTNDIGEQRDISIENPEMLKTLREQLRDYLNELSRNDHNLGTVDPESAPLTDKEREDLEAMGYL